MDDELMGPEEIASLMSDPIGHLQFSKRFDKSRFERLCRTALAAHKLKERVDWLDGENQRLAENGAKLHSRVGDLENKLEEFGYYVD